MSITKHVLAAMEPVVAMLRDMQKRIDSLPAPERGEKGEPGEPGKDAEPLSVDEVVKALAVELGDSLKGEPGKDAAPVDPAEVAKCLAADHAELLKGEPGKDAEAVDPIEVARALYAAHGKDLRGTDGRDGLGIEVKQYAPGVYREGTFCTANFGQYFKAVRDTAAAPGESDDWERIGSAGFRFTGAFDEGKQYASGDLFVRDFGCFLVVDGEAKLLAGRGAKGERGAVGPSGANGKDGKDGSTIVSFEQTPAGFQMVYEKAGKLEAVSCDFSAALVEMAQPLLEKIAALESRLAAMEGN